MRVYFIAWNDEWRPVEQTGYFDSAEYILFHRLVCKGQRILEKTEQSIKEVYRHE